MPSPDATFYNLKRLHVVFALAALAMLAVTVWMIAADHFRDWKQYQRTFRDRVEPWLAEAALRQEQSTQFRADEERLAQALDEARRTVPEKALVDRFREAAGGGDALATAYERLAAEPSPAARESFLACLAPYLAAARLEQDNADRRLRFRRAEFDEARTNYEAAVGEGPAPSRLSALRATAEILREQVAALTLSSEQAGGHHARLQSIYAEIERPEVRAREAMRRHRANVDRLQRTVTEQQPSFAHRMLGWPFLEAFARPLTVDQTWLPDLTIDYNFRRVARFDRCRTCHQGIDRAAPGSAVEPLCASERVLKLSLPTPTTSPEAEKSPQPAQPSLETVYGFTVMEGGVLDPAAAAVALVEPKSAAARAGLMPGDVLLAVAGQPVATPADLAPRLLDVAAWGKPIGIEVRRGLPHPYRSHPRLDLYLGSQSPHPLGEFGCTVCHDGQGSATQFKFASHTPNDPDQQARWRQQHSWFWNPDWGFPMRPARLAQSNCLKCHHQVSELEPSRRFPDPPAAKLVAGYHQVRQLGCFGCHEIKGVGPAGERIGPDLRLEPNYHEAALTLLADPGLREDQQTLARQVVAHPENRELRRQLVALLRPAEVSPSAATIPGQANKSAPGDPIAANFKNAHSRVMLNLLSSENTAPGTMRKVGPSLRGLSAKLAPPFLRAWIARPSDFRPATRMPQFFGMREHLDGKGLDEAQRYEPVEIHAIQQYLLAVSPPLSPPPGADRALQTASVERGKRLFQTLGCLACHQHVDFPAAQSTQGPDLSRLGSKLTTPSGHTWLVSWLRDPTRYAPRTLMPNALLPPTAEAGQGSGAAPDPAADIAAYLVSSSAWRAPPLAAWVESDLDALARMYLEGLFPRSTAQAYLRDGIPDRLAEQVPADARELLGPAATEKKTRFVGRRAIRKRGCFGCHDIPGFEDAALIGPALSDWGRKQESLLAFEQVHRFVLSTGSSAPPAAPSGATATAGTDAARAESAGNSADEGFFLDAIVGKRREGFLWQKLRAPRSFDYQKSAGKSFNEQLLMGRFTLTPDQREAIMTFVLGLVADPPNSQYVYQPDRRTRALVEGRKVLDRYGCAQCHTLEMERWTIEFPPDKAPQPIAAADYPFLKPQVAQAEIAASLQEDRRGMLRAELVGMPQWNAQGELEQTEDEDGNPLYSFTLWEPAAIAGHVWPVGGAGVLAGPGQIVARRPALGGAFARLLYPVAIEEGKKSGSTATVVEAWGWVPPALVHEGRIVQPAWLYGYLLNPSVIRPAALLRMPKFNFAPDEAAQLVDYFAAVAGVEFPYTADARVASQPAGGEPTPGPRADDALRLLTDRTTYCAKCHLVGDFGPDGENRTVLAPNLDRVGSRIRPEYLRRWLANPKSVLPYTAMPVNFPHDQTLGQDLLKGSSLEQLDAVMDLLVHYGEHLKRRASIRKMIESGARR